MSESETYVNQWPDGLPFSLLIITFRGWQGVKYPGPVYSLLLLFFLFFYILILFFKTGFSAYGLSLSEEIPYFDSSELDRSAAFRVTVRTWLPDNARISRTAVAAVSSISHFWKAWLSTYGHSRARKCQSCIPRNRTAERSAPSL